MEEITTGHVMIIAGLFGGLGYTTFLLLLALLPKRLKAENLAEKELLVKRGSDKASQIRHEGEKSTKRRISLLEEDMEAELVDAKESIETVENELNTLEATIEQTESRIKAQEKDLLQKQRRLDVLIKRSDSLLEENLSTRNQLFKKLEDVTKIDRSKAVDNIVSEHLHNRKLEMQRFLKTTQEELENQKRKQANRLLSRVCSRYAPGFVWPKSSYTVDIENKSTLDLVLSEKYNLIEELSVLTEGVSVSLNTDKGDTPTGIKLVGGYGIFKEAARQTLEEVLKRHPNQWSKLAKIYQSKVADLNQIAKELGQEAARILELPNLHPEIMRMVGALNWRTSYRQNQYLHSLEVAQLAGILAFEIGVCPNEAKRCGLLHDIGKGIDYRIEGSHAVISGDYADRYGERKIICDTVMSHHNDLVLETPLSYVLKSADTLSGARPGARVNLEEGYQIRISAIEQTIRAFDGVSQIAIMSGGREVHVEVNCKKIGESRLKGLASEMARQIEENVAYPGQIKVLLTRRFEASAVA